MVEVSAKIAKLRVVLLQSIDRHCIRNGLNQTAIVGAGYNAEGLQPQLQSMLVKDVLGLRDKLASELLLSQIVARLHDERDEVYPQLRVALLNLTLRDDVLLHFGEGLLAEEAVGFKAFNDRGFMVGVRAALAALLHESPGAVGEEIIVVFFLSRLKAVSAADGSVMSVRLTVV